MTGRADGTMRDPLELELEALGRAVAFPATPDLAATVSHRLTVATRPKAARGGLRGFPFGRPLRRGLLLAVVLLLVVVGAVAAVRVGLDLLEIRFGPVQTTTPPALSPSAGPSGTSTASALAGAQLGLGEAATLDEARAAARFPLLVPTGLGPADRVYIGGAALHGQVALAYAAGPGLPPAPLLDGAGLLITEAQGGPDLGLATKLVDAGLATVETVDVGGSTGYWIAGQPHDFWYLGPDGTVIDDSRRLVGDTLVWERDGILYRIEGPTDLARALEIATSMR